MKGQSDTKPNTQLKSGGKTQVLYNIKQITITNMDGTTRTAWEYDYVEIEGDVTNAKIKAALQKAEINTVTPAIDSVITDYTNANNELALSVIAPKIYAEVDTYIDTNVIDLPSAKAYLKKLSRVVLAMLNRD